MQVVLHKMSRQTCLEGCPWRPQLQGRISLSVDALVGLGSHQAETKNSEFVELDALMGLSSPQAASQSASASASADLFGGLAVGGETGSHSTQPASVALSP